MCMCFAAALALHIGSYWDASDGKFQHLIALYEKLSCQVVAEVINGCSATLINFVSLWYASVIL